MSLNLIALGILALFIPILSYVIIAKYKPKLKFLDSEQEKLYVLTNRFCYVIMAGSGSFFVLFLIVGNTHLIVAELISYLVFSVCLILNRLGYHNLAKMGSIISVNLAIFHFASFMGDETRTNTLFFTTAWMPLMLFRKQEKYKITFGLLLSISCFFMVEYTEFSFISANLLSGLFEEAYMILVLSIAFFSNIAFSISYFRIQYQYEEKLKAATDEIHDLKLKKIQRELKQQIELKEKALVVAKDASAFETFAVLTKQISHEIRNPMSGIMLSTDTFEDKLVAADGQLDEKSVRRFIEFLRYTSSRIFNVLDTMLKYGKSRTPTKVDVDVKETIESVLIIINLYAKKNNVTIDNRVTEPINVIGFQTRLEQVFTNLIKNATEAMPPGKRDGRITVSARYSAYEHADKPVEHGVRIDITDNGKGIPKDRLTNIFDPFVTHRYGGTGLGLSVVHDIIHDHKGQILIASEEGKGTTMSVFLPAAK